jgi:hypothetical protein
VDGDPPPYLRGPGPLRAVEAQREAIAKAADWFA